MDGNAHKKQSASLATNQPHGDVRQDKIAHPRALLGSIEPSVLSEPAIMSVPKHHGSSRRKTVAIGVCISPELKAELERLCTQGAAKAKRLSISKLAGQFIAQGVQGQLDRQYDALLTPVIEQAIDKRLRARETRFAALLVRIAFDSGQNRALLTTLLARSPGLTPEQLSAILEQSGKRAKAKLARLSPQISELIQIVESWMTDTDKAGSVSAPAAG